MQLRAWNLNLVVFHLFQFGRVHDVLVIRLPASSLFGLLTSLPSDVTILPTERTGTSKTETGSHEAAGKMRKYSFMLLGCFLLMYLGVLGYVVLEAFGELF